LDELRTALELATEEELQQITNILFCRRCQILVRVCHFLKVPYSQKMPTTEIEAEIYLHLVNKAWKRLPPSEQKSLSIQIQKALADSHTPQPLPVHLQHNPLDIVLKGGSVIAVNSILKPILLKHIAGQFALHFVRYQGAKTALVQGGQLLIKSPYKRLNRA